MLSALTSNGMFVSSGMVVARLMPKGKQIISADWVHDSLQTCSVNEFAVKSVGGFRDIGYNYQRWSARAGEHQTGGQVHLLPAEKVTGTQREVRLTKCFS